MRPGAHVFQVYRAGEDPLLWWRLISSNGRVLGCTTTPEASMVELRSSIKTVVDYADDLVASLRLTADHRWQWTLSLADRPIVRGASSHDRHVRCEMAWQRFVLATPLAVIDDEVHAFRACCRPAPVELSRLRPRQLA